MLDDLFGGSGSGRETAVKLFALAQQRGHTARSCLSSPEADLNLAHAPDADLDAEFDATCLETGERLTVCGWLFEPAEADGLTGIESVDGSVALHRVLHAALSAGCPPPVAAVIVDWSQRDSVDALLDARLLRQAFEATSPERLTASGSIVARRAYTDWVRDFNAEERVANAEKLAEVMTEWADTVLGDALTERDTGQ